MIDKNNTQSTLHFLINAEFTVERGYSYGELLNFLKTFQVYYRECYIKRDQFEQELNYKNTTLVDESNRMLNAEKLLQEKIKENTFLFEKISRKLTFWERVTGRIKIKY